MRRWLAQDALKPWQHQSWIFIRDPKFEAKASVVLDLYARTYQGVSLGADEYVISADRKTLHPGPTALPRHAAGRQRPSYARQSRLSPRWGIGHMAAYDVHHARVFGRCEQSTGIVPFTALVDQVMAQEPYASAHRVFWIVDNGSSHRGRAAVDRLSARYPNAVMVHTPVHASWLNQVEIFFSIIQRKVLSPNNFEDLTAVERRLLAFEERYNATAAPFKWRYTTADLHRHLDRLDHHDRTLQAA